jgi:hypothetical protein
MCGTPRVTVVPINYISLELNERIFKLFSYVLFPEINRYDSSPAYLTKLE